MRILICTEGTFEFGRGPVSRLCGLLPHLGRMHTVGLVVLGRIGPELAKASAGLECVCVEPDYSGWRMKNAASIRDQVVHIARGFGADLTVLQMEIWDLCLELWGVDFKFVPMFHGIPFINCPPSLERPYLVEVARASIHDRDLSHLAFRATRAGGFSKVCVDKLILSPNPTVTAYMERYSPRSKIVEVSPGYAVDAEWIAACSPDSPDTDFAFMAKLTKDKGIFRLLSVLDEVDALLSGAWTCTIVGSFDSPKTERTFQRRLARRSWRRNIRLVGWLSGDARFAEVGRAKVFLYPAIGTDSFAQVVGEAICAGLTPVCCDGPYINRTYSLDSLRVVSEWSPRKFASAAVGAMDDRRVRGAAAAQRAGLNDSWALAAQAEATAYATCASLLASIPVGR